MDYAMDYKKIHNCIRISCKPSRKTPISFAINYDKLNGLVADLNIEAVVADKESRKIGPTDIILLSEYFKGAKLKWFDDFKEYLIILFVDKDAIDEHCRYLMSQIKESQIDNPDVDRVDIIANLLADYPCYMCAVVSYSSNNPRRINLPSYEMKCRFNTVAMKKSEKEAYDDRDKKEEEREEALEEASTDAVDQEEETEGVIGPVGEQGDAGVEDNADVEETTESDEEEEIENESGNE